MSLPAFLLHIDTAENRTLRRARALSKREAFVASGRGRRQAAEAGADLRSKYADSPRKAPARYRCDVIESQPAMRRINGTPNPRRIELCAGRGRKENAASTQGEARFPNGSPGGKCIPESALRLGRSFRMAPQAETATRNRAVEWDMLSQWQLKRKVHPGIRAQNGTRFPNGGPSGKRILESRLKLGHTFRFTCRLEKPARSPSQNWVEEGQNETAGGQYDCRR